MTNKEAKFTLDESSLNIEKRSVTVATINT